MYTWTFRLNGLLIPNGWEPIGWDKVKFTLRRASGDIGYDFTFSDSLQFDGYAAQILRAAYEAEFIDAHVDIQIDHCQGWTYQGVINFTLYKEENGYITAGIKESGFSNLFTTRYDTPVDLSKTVSIDGNPLTTLSPVDLSLHSKEIFFTDKYLINPLLKNSEDFGVLTATEGDVKFTPPFQIKSADIEESLDPTDYSENNPFIYSGFTYPAGKLLRTIPASGRLKFELFILPPSAPDPGNLIGVEVRLIVRGATSGTIHADVLLLSDTIHEAVAKTFDTGAFSNSLDFPPDSNLFIWIRLQSITFPYSVTFHFNKTVSYLNLEESSTFPASTAKAYLLYEAINRVAESITGIENVLVSDFLGRTDSLPTAYTADGPGSLIALTNGFAIRKFTGKPVVVSFKQLFEALNVIFNLGFRIEGSKIRIEPKQYFYRLEAVARFSFVKQISEQVSLTDIYSEVEIEFQNQGDTKQINKLDEFNTKRSYVTPIRQHKNKLSLTTNVITSGYAIEFTRREQFAASPTTDYPTDNDAFLIALVRSGLSFIPEKDESFSPVTGLISPTTAYNLRFAPVRCLHRWEKAFSGCLFRSYDKVVKFQAGTGNYLLDSGGIKENESISADVDNALFIPIEANFEYPLTFGEFLALKDASIKAVEYSCSKLDHQKAFLREISYEPNREGGIALFKLIQANANRDENHPDV